MDNDSGIFLRNYGMRRRTRIGMQEHGADGTIEKWLKQVKRDMKDTGKRGNPTISRRLSFWNELKIDCIYVLSLKTQAAALAAAAALRACRCHQYHDTSALIQ